jgi:opacity protein-like surface antigen
MLWGVDMSNLLMFGRLARAAGAAVVSVALAQAAHAAPVTQNFESFSDSEVLTTQIAGWTFSNAQVLTVGLSLNELDFPPASGTNLLFENGQGMRIDFAAPVFSVAGFFTYLDGLSFQAFDAADNLISAQGRTSMNTGTADFISLSNAGGLISYVVINGALGGFSFVLDDLTVDFGTSVPEPQTLALVASMLAAGAMPGGWLRRRKRA